MSEDLNKLRELAEAATPGPWSKHDHTTFPFDRPEEWVGYARVGFGGEPDGRFAGTLASLDRRNDCHKEFKTRAADDAAFIAAFNPATALSLLSRLQAAEERAEKLEGAVRTVRQVLIDHGSGTCGPHCEAMYGEETYFKDEIVLLNAALKTEGA